MKKFFYLATFVVAMALSACGGDNQDAPRAIKFMTEQAQKELVGKAGEGMRFIDVRTEGNDLVFDLEFDENMTRGISIRDALQMSGHHADEIAQTILNRMNSDTDNQSRNISIGVMRLYKYNLVARIRGNRSGDEISSRVRWQDMPEYTITEEEVNHLLDEKGYGVSSSQASVRAIPVQVPTTQTEPQPQVEEISDPYSAYDQKDERKALGNKLAAYVIPTSNYVMKGSKYSAQIVVAAIDTTLRPDYYIDGKEINRHGLYEVNTSTTGQKRYEGYVSIMNDDEIIRLPFWSEYTVAEPALVISNNDMNILYRGYDNKFSVSVPGVPDEKLRVSVNGASSSQRKGYWIITPADGAKTVTISVQAEVDGKMQLIGSKEYRVKSLPTPNVYFAVNGKEYSSGSIASSVLQKRDGEIVASYGPDGMLEMEFKVTGFTSVIGGQTMKAEGNRFTNAQLNQIAKQKKGSIVILQDIRAKSPRGDELRLSPLVLTVD